MKVVQQVRHATAAANAYTGLEGQISVDSTIDSLRIHDGITPGGKEIRHLEYLNPGVNKQRFFKQVLIRTTGQSLLASECGSLVIVNGSVNAPSLATVPFLGMGFIYYGTTTGNVTRGSLNDFFLDVDETDKISVQVLNDRCVAFAKYDATHWKVLWKY